jgi:hypothetical protein
MRLPLQRLQLLRLRGQCLVRAHGVLLRRLLHVLSLRVVVEVVETTKSVALVVGLLLVRVLRIVVVTIARVTAVRKHMATRLVLVDHFRLQFRIRVLVVVGIGVVGLLVSLLNLSAQELVVIRAEAADPVSLLLHHCHRLTLELFLALRTQAVSINLLVYLRCRYQLVRIRRELKQLVGVGITQLVGMHPTSQV